MMNPDAEERSSYKMPTYWKGRTGGMQNYLSEKH